MVLRAIQINNMYSVINIYKYLLRKAEVPGTGTKSVPLTSKTTQ
jgi:hypothetical protein